MGVLKFENSTGSHEVKLIVKNDAFVYAENGVFIGNRISPFFDDQLESFKESYREPPVNYDIDWDYLYAWFESLVFNN